VARLQRRLHRQLFHLERLRDEGLDDEEDEEGQRQRLDDLQEAAEPGPAQAAEAATVGILTPAGLDVGVDGLGLATIEWMQGVVRVVPGQRVPAGASSGTFQPISSQPRMCGNPSPGVHEGQPQRVRPPSSDR
jgi:hypothetical protein